MPASSFYVGGGVGGNTAAKSSFYEMNDAGAQQPALLSGYANVEFVISNGGSQLLTGVVGYLQIPFNCQVTSWTLLSDASGSAALDVFKCAYADYNPPTRPTFSDSISGGATCSISSAVKNTDSTLAAWTNTTINAGDILAVNVTSSSGPTKLTLSLTVKKT